VAWVVGGCLGKKVSLRTTSLRDVVKNLTIPYLTYFQKT
jgi:hypothetical protein